MRIFAAGIGLALSGCVEEGSELYPPPGVSLELEVGQLLAGQHLDITVRQADPGEEVWVVWSDDGMGVGPCPAALQGACLNVRNPTPVGPMTASSAGVAMAAPLIRATATRGVEVCMQAVAIRTASRTVTSEVVCRGMSLGAPALLDGSNTTPDFDDRVSMGGPDLSFAMRYEPTSRVTARYVEVFTGGGRGTNGLGIYRHDPVHDQPGALEARTRWSMSARTEWQGGLLDRPVTMMPGSVWWVVWRPVNGSQASQAASGDSVSYRGSFDRGQTWNGPFQDALKFKLCSGGGCP